MGALVMTVDAALEQLRELADDRPGRLRWP
jgi:hypothetical protein